MGWNYGTYERVRNGAVVIGVNIKHVTPYLDANTVLCTVGQAI